MAAWNRQTPGIEALSALREIADAVNKETAKTGFGRNKTDQNSTQLACNTSCRRTAFPSSSSLSPLSPSLCCLSPACLPYPGNTAELNFDLLAPASQNDETESVDATELEPFAVPPVLISVFLWLAVGMVVFHFVIAGNRAIALPNSGGISLSLTIYVLLRFVLPALLVPQKCRPVTRPTALGIVVPTIRW